MGQTCAILQPSRYNKKAKAVPAMSDDTALEREKFEFDKQMRIAERDLKVTEANRSRWSNPLVVALVGAVLVGIGNIGITFVHESNEQDLAARANLRQSALENFRAENTNIIEILKLSDTEKVRTGLCRLMRLNAIKTPDTSSYVQTYIGNVKCDLISSDGATNAQTAPTGTEWKHVEARIPGCGVSGCYQTFRVCGMPPPNTTLTGATRNFVDSFSGAWGNWGDPATVSQQGVCRIFVQHSHNVARAVAFDYEVAPVH